MERALIDDACRLFTARVIDTTRLTKAEVQSAVDEACATASVTS
jgi:hypothetical protein